MPKKKTRKKKAKTKKTRAPGARPARAGTRSTDRHPGAKNLQLTGFYVLLLQVLFLLAVAAGFMLPYAFGAFAAAEALLLALILWSVWQLRAHVGPDFRLYAAFFLGITVLLELFFFAPSLLPDTAAQGYLSIALIFGLALFFIAFKAVFARNHCLAVVQSAGGGSATVRTYYDLLSFVGKKTLTVSAPAGVRAGDVVRVHFKRGLFSMNPVRAEHP